MAEPALPEAAVKSVPEATRLLAPVVSLRAGAERVDVHCEA